MTDTFQASLDVITITFSDQFVLQILFKWVEVRAVNIRVYLHGLWAVIGQNEQLLKNYDKIMLFFWLKCLEALTLQ